MGQCVRRWPWGISLRKTEDSVSEDDLEEEAHENTARQSRGLTPRPRRLCILSHFFDEKRQRSMRIPLNFCAIFKCNSSKCRSHQRKFLSALCACHILSPFSVQLHQLRRVTHRRSRIGQCWCVSIYIYMNGLCHSFFWHVYRNPTEPLNCYFQTKFQL